MTPTEYIQCLARLNQFQQAVDQRMKSCVSQLEINMAVLSLRDARAELEQLLAESTPAEREAASRQAAQDVALAVNS